MSGMLKIMTTAGLLAMLAYLADRGGDDVTESLLDLGRMPRAEMEVRGFHQLFTSYYIQNDRFPRSPGEVKSLFRSNYDKPPEIVGTDPWGNPYLFLSRDWEINCAGPDLSSGSADDIIRDYPTGTTRPNLGGQRWIAIGQRTAPTSSVASGGTSLSGGVEDALSRTTLALASFLDGALGEGDAVEYEPFTIEQMEGILRVYSAETEDEEKEIALYAAALEEMLAVHEVFLNYYEDRGRYPATLQEAGDLLERSFGSQLSEFCVDPWGQSYRFLSGEWEIECSGMDRAAWTNDDIVKTYPPGAFRPNIMEGAGVQYAQK